MNLANAPFSSYLAKQVEIDAAWNLCEARFAALPSPLDALATRFLSSITNEGATHRAYFSNPLAPPLLYMPLWLADGLANAQHWSPEATLALPHILAGTMQGYVFIRIQDDVVDEPGRADPQLLLFGNACFSGMIAAYAEALGARATKFWPTFDRACLDFSRFTLAEQRAVRHDEHYSRERFDEHADKVAFARVPLLAVAALADRDDLGPHIETLIHELGIAHGLVNDVVGWPRDLRAGQRTWLLASAGLSQADLEALRGRAPGPERDEVTNALMGRLRQSLYEGRLIHEALTRAIEVQRRAAETARNLGLLGFDAYTTERIAWLELLDRQTSLLTLQRALKLHPR